MKKIAILALVLAMLLSAAALAEPAIPAQVGAEAPDFELTKADGETFRLSDYRGKVVFVNIWATWCPPCVAEMPEIDQLSRDYPDDLVVIGVSCDDSEQDMLDFIEKYGYTYNFAMDSDYLVSGLLFPTYAIPNSVFIDPNGIVTSIEVGAANYEILEQRFLDAQANAAQD